MSAEVLLDAFGQVLESPTKFRSVAGDFPRGTRAIDLPDEAVPSHFLDVFGLNGDLNKEVRTTIQNAIGRIGAENTGDADNPDHFLDK